MKNITVLVSGSGSNLQRIVDCIDNGEIPNAKVNLVVADRDCYALERAENHQIPHQLIKRGKDFSENLEKLLPENTDLIVLAGFLSILSKEFCEKYKGKIINIHPALLPKFGGKGMWGHHVHEAVIAAQEKESGATVHFVTSGIDEGEIILQGKFEIAENDTPETLVQKVHEIEYDIFPKAINKALNPITDEEKIILEGIKKILFNAKELYDDANLLYENNRINRAFTLYKICIEELGKLTMFIDYLLRGSKDFKQLLKDYTKHNIKFEYSTSIELILMDLVNDENLKLNFLKLFFEQQDEIKKLDALKNSSLYVDYLNGEFKLPSEVIMTTNVDKIKIYTELKLNSLLQLHNLIINNYENVKPFIYLYDNEEVFTRKIKSITKYINQVIK